MTSNHRQELDAAFKKKMAQYHDVIRETALNIDADLVSQTPVDTGRARSNWFVTTGAPSTETTENNSPQLDKNRAVISRSKLGETIFITNNLPYIRRLNEGHSKRQQPTPGWVDAIVDKHTSRIKRIAKVILRGGAL